MVELRSGKHAISGEARRDQERPEKSEPASNKGRNDPKTSTPPERDSLAEKNSISGKGNPSSAIPKKRPNDDSAENARKKKPSHTEHEAPLGGNSESISENRDRLPTPGRIINPREVNEEGAKAIPSTGNPQDWPSIRDKDYSSKSYIKFDEQMMDHEDNTDRPFPPPPKKGRRTAAEKEAHYNFEVRNDPNHSSHALYLCFDRGPDGPPTYDRCGFELDYDKVADWFKSMTRASMKPTKKSERNLEKRMKDDKRMVEIFFEPGAAPESTVTRIGYCQDRVSKDIGVPWHKVGVEEFEEWERRGFQKAKRGQYERETFNSEEQSRMIKMLEGSKLRK